MTSARRCVTSLRAHRFRSWSRSSSLRFSSATSVDQFTAAGEATEQARAAFDQHFLRPGELQTTACAASRTLDELQRLLAAHELDGSKASALSEN